MKRREGEMVGLHIDCECGEVVRGATEDDLVAAVETHVAQSHPDLVGKLSRTDIVAMAVEDD